MERQIGRWRLAVDKQRDPIENIASNTPFKSGWIIFSSNGDAVRVRYFYFYEDDRDVLHIRFSFPDIAYTEEEEEDIIVIRSEKDDQVVGLIIPEYSKRDREHLKATLPWLDVDTLPSVDTGDPRLRGKYAFVPTSAEEFLRRKHKEVSIE